MLKHQVKVEITGSKGIDRERLFGRLNQKSFKNLGSRKDPKSPNFGSSHNDALPTNQSLVSLPQKHHEIVQSRDQAHKIDKIFITAGETAAVLGHDDKPRTSPPTSPPVPQDDDQQPLQSDKNELSDLLKDL